LLSVAQEFRRLKNLEAGRTFAVFAERFRERMQAKVLARIKRQQGDPNWKPGGTFQRMAFQNEISKRLGRFYERVGREVKVASEPDAFLAVLTNPAYHFKRIGLEAGPLRRSRFFSLCPPSQHF
jgi:hypothetical protein